LLHRVIIDTKSTMRLSNLLRSALMFGESSAPLRSPARPVPYHAPECAGAGTPMVRASGPYRVTEQLRRWTSACYFDDLEGAREYARGTDGTVWERYTGPTGAENWWSLDEL
jgi:hypothetical protein